MQLTTEGSKQAELSGSRQRLLMSAPLCALPQWGYLRGSFGAWIMLLKTGPGDSSIPAHISFLRNGKGVNFQGVAAA